MELVETEQGVTLAFVTPEKLHSNKQCIGFALILAFIPFGGIVMLINAYLHFTKKYIMCFDVNGNWDKSVIKRLSKEEEENEYNNGLIYIIALLAFRVCPILFLLLRFY